VIVDVVESSSYAATFVIEFERVLVRDERSSGLFITTAARKGVVAGVCQQHMFVVNATPYLVIAEQRGNER